MIIHVCVMFGVKRSSKVFCILVLFTLKCIYNSSMFQVTGEKRALKVPKRSGVQKATQRETEALLSLKHPNIVQLFGIEDEV